MVHSLWYFISHWITTIPYKAIWVWLKRIYFVHLSCCIMMPFSDVVLFYFYTKTVFNIGFANENTIKTVFFTFLPPNVHSIVLHNHHLAVEWGALSFFIHTHIQFASHFWHMYKIMFHLDISFAVNHSAATCSRNFLGVVSLYEQTILPLER